MTSYRSQYSVANQLNTLMNHCIHIAKLKPSVGYITEYCDL